MDWICRDCGHIFDEGEALPVREYHPEVPGDAYEEFIACPSCGSDQIEKAAKCKCCHGSFLSEQLAGGYYCRECMEAFMESNMDEFAEYIYNAEEGVK